MEAGGLAFAPGLETIVPRLRLRGSGPALLVYAHKHRHAVSDRAGAAGAGQALGPAAPLF